MTIDKKKVEHAAEKIEALLLFTKATGMETRQSQAKFLAALNAEETALLAEMITKRTDDEPHK